MNGAPRRWYRPRLRSLLLLVLVSTVGWSAYAYWLDYQEDAARRERETLSPGRGAMCTVVFQRDLIGVERMAPAPATVNGVENSVTGRFVLMNDDWIVLSGPSEVDARQRWIPRGNVLLLQVEPSP